MSAKRTHVVIPEQLIADIDDLVGKRGRSQFLVLAATHEIKRRRQMRTLEDAAGAWTTEDHPELAGGVTSYVRRLRGEGEHRLPGTASRR
jgi:hypothetical protein